ncbi:MAG TPA: hypothetical protein VHW96_11570 [Solirubrobacteraceae bacterium]|jgi:hypothetical protein|nr:hypothetical protein [Solirubrobacteraceae bacterium]
MRRTVLITTVALAALAGVPATGATAPRTAPPVNAHVTPGTGGPRTAFTLSFRSPAQTGQVGSMRRAETVEVHGTHHSGCVWSGQMAVPTAVSQQLVRVTLTPGKMGGAGARTWCTGTFHGSIVQTEHFMCGPPDLCPLLEIRPQTIANFTFKVKRRA